MSFIGGCTISSRHLRLWNCNIASTQPWHHGDSTPREAVRHGSCTHQAGIIECAGGHEACGSEAGRRPYDGKRRRRPICAPCMCCGGMISLAVLIGFGVWFCASARVIHWVEALRSTSGYLDAPWAHPHDPARHVHNSSWRQATPDSSAYLNPSFLTEEEANHLRSLLVPRAERDGDAGPKDRPYPGYKSLVAAAACAKEEAPADRLQGAPTTGCLRADVLPRCLRPPTLPPPPRWTPMQRVQRHLPSHNVWTVTSRHDQPGRGKEGDRWSGRAKALCPSSNINDFNLYR